MSHPSSVKRTGPGIDGTAVLTLSIVLMTAVCLTKIGSFDLVFPAFCCMGVLFIVSVVVLFASIGSGIIAIRHGDRYTSQQRFLQALYALLALAIILFTVFTQFVGLLL